MSESVVPPLPRVPSGVRRRQRLLDASMWIGVVGVLGFAGALWGPVELRDGLTVLVAMMALAGGLHALARPALLWWTNPARDVELPGQTRALLAGTAVSAVAVASGTVSDGGEESDDVRLRVGARVLLAPSVVAVEPRRLAALLLTAPQADRGSVAPAVLSALVAVLAGRHHLWGGVVVAVLVTVGFVALGLLHVRRGRLPDEAMLERTGADAVLFAFLVQGWTIAARRARRDPTDARDFWRQWVHGARQAAEETDGLTRADVDAELARLPTWDH